MRATLDHDLATVAAELDAEVPGDLVDEPLEIVCHRRIVHPVAPRTFGGVTR